ncbi:MAG TPA: hypothetical protein VIB82_01155 [Caulobacteraceae bacterium]|jgi:hypothetical protein
MTAAPFRAVGGAVVADYGVIALAQARALAEFYGREAAVLPFASRARAVCAARAHALDRAARDACLWRRAAGWADPDEADAIHA